MSRLAAAACLLLAPALLSAQQAQTTRGLSEPVYTQTVQESYRIPTAHGVIYGEVIRPVVPAGITVPVILTYSPYNILGSPSNQAASIADDSLASFYAPRGYARAVFDVVGTRESSGCYDYGGLRERETGAAVVDFLGGQAWANGKVGMIGGSYDGTTQWAAAVQQPKHLTTVIPQVAIDRWYDYAYGGGIRYFLNEESASEEGFDTPLAFDFGFGFAPPLDVTDPAAFAEVVRTRYTPCDGLEHTQRGYDPDPVYDAFWQERDYRALAGRITASALIEGGWLDHNVKHWDSTRMFQTLPETHPKKLVMGQWSHSASQFNDAANIRHAWFDFWLLGLPTGVMDLPRVDTAANDGKRRQEISWPPPGTSDIALPLGSALILRNVTAPGWTDTDVALTEERLFGDGCGTACLMFTTEPVTAALRIAGSPRLQLTGTSDQESTHLVPVLYDEAADGRAQIITRGFLNLRNRNGLDKSEPVVPGTPWQATVEFWDVDWVMPAGHRVGVAIMSSNAYWALPDAPRTATTLDLAQSRLVLPLAEGGTAFVPAPAKTAQGRGLLLGAFTPTALIFPLITLLIRRRHPSLDQHL